MKIPWQLATVYYQLSKRLKFKAIIKYLQPHHYGDCLDIGTGTGGLAFLYKEYGERWLYAENDPLVIESAKSLLGASKIITEFDQLKDLKFDLITMIDSIFYFDQPGQIIDRLRTLLKPEGALLITATDGDPKRAINVLREKINLGKAARGFAFEESPDDFANRFRQKKWRSIYFKTFSFALAEVLMVIYDLLQRHTFPPAENKNQEASLLTNRSAIDQKKIWLLRLSFPVFYCLSLLDWPLRPVLRGYKFILVVKPPTQVEHER